MAKESPSFESEDRLLSGYSPEGGEGPFDQPLRPRSSHVLHFAILYSTVGALLTFILLSQNFPWRAQDPSQGIYSPAQKTIKYETRVFDENFVNKGPYMGSEVDGIPTDETDARWEDLFQFGISSISTEEARGLPNSTASIPNQPDKWVVELDVFHQLHCLNALRKTFFPERYGPRGDFDDYFGSDGKRNYTSTSAKHYDHCIDSIRQSIMCHGDIATVYWRWNDVRRIPIPSLAITHTCRNFDAIRDWAKDHQLVNDEEKLKWAKGPKESFKLSS